MSEWWSERQSGQSHSWKNILLLLGICVNSVCTRTIICLTGCSPCVTGLDKRKATWQFISFGMPALCRFTQSHRLICISYLHNNRNINCSHAELSQNMHTLFIVSLGSVENWDNNGEWSKQTSLYHEKIHIWVFVKKFNM